MKKRHKKISLRTLDESEENEIREFLDELEQNLELDSLSHILHSLLHELITNGVKANLKRAFFQEHEYDPDDPESYIRGVREFKDNYLELADKSIHRRALKNLDLNTTIEFHMDEDRLLIQVENNVLMLPEEERRIRDKLNKAMGTRDLVEYAKDYEDETEGKGLGLAMIILLIKFLGFSPEHFRVYSHEGGTIARLEFPLNKDYVPIRARKHTSGSNGDDEEHSARFQATPIEQAASGFVMPGRVRPA